jgi:hypothetical protein
VFLYRQGETTAINRRVWIHLVSITDGLTPQLAEAGQPQISKNGASFVNTSALITGVGNGLYYVELTAGELDTLGFFVVRYKTANTAESQVVGQVVAFNPYDAVALGLSKLTSFAADVWNALLSSFTLAGSFGQKIGLFQTGAGTGAIAWEYFVTTPAGLPNPGVQVTVTSDSNGLVPLGTVTTDGNGRALFFLNAGTYYFWSQKAGWTFNNPDTEVVS